MAGPGAAAADVAWDAARPGVGPCGAAAVHEAGADPDLGASYEVRPHLDRSVPHQKILQDEDQAARLDGVLSFQDCWDQEASTWSLTDFQTDSTPV